MNITNGIMGDTNNPLIALLGAYTENFVGYVYTMSFDEAHLLTNDAWKSQVGGIPHNSFLVATAFNPEQFAAAHEVDREVLLLRVLGPSPLPQDGELLRYRVEHNQRRTREEVFNQDHAGDPITRDSLQYGGLHCRVLGTFFIENGNLRLGSDVENYMTSTRLRVFKPRDKALERIVNHINQEVLNKAESEAKKSGFNKLPTPIQIGTLRYTSTARIHRSSKEPPVSVLIQPSDFLAHRTAVLGMTRTGKSNTVKSTVAAVHISALSAGIKVGQIIFDINGEYANANHQDDDSSIAKVFEKSCVRYRAIQTEGFEDLRTNFYEQCAEGLNLLAQLSKDDQYRNQTDLELFLDSGLEEPDKTDHSDHTRWKVRKAIFQCILYSADYRPSKDYIISFPANEEVLNEVSKNSDEQKNDKDFSGDVKMSLENARDWFIAARERNYKLQKEQEEAGKKKIGLKSSSGKPWVDSVTEAYLNVLARKNNTGTPIRGYRAIISYGEYHSSQRRSDVVKEILDHLQKGKIVILDLSCGPVTARTTLSERIARQIFENSFKEMNSGKVPQNIVIYVEEAHNLIGKQDDLTKTWPRIAKEGAKAKIAFVYATQEPSSIHPNILANTENWFITHLNNDDELRVLGKFYDFADFQSSLKSAQDVGFARVKTLSTPFVIPTQIKRFEPKELEKQLFQIQADKAD